MKRTKYSVYTLKCIHNQRVYIGMTSQCLAVRWRSGKGYWGNKELWKDICLYGWDAFEKTVIATNLSKGNAQKLERRLIKEFQSKDSQLCYNKTQGGEIGAVGHRSFWKDKFGDKHNLSKRVYCPELGETFGSMSQAGLFAGVSAGAISACVNGKSKTAGTHYVTGERLHWEYADKQNTNERKEETL